MSMLGNEPASKRDVTTWACLILSAVYASNTTSPAISNAAAFVWLGLALYAGYVDLRMALRTH